MSNNTMKTLARKYECQGLSVPCHLFENKQHFKMLEARQAENRLALGPTAERNNGKQGTVYQIHSFKTGSESPLIHKQDSTYGDIVILVSVSCSIFLRFLPSLPIRRPTKLL